ncbi:MAG: bifunctional metallophosphatase/5'-nucleotidase [Schwartzia sp. (in: firmicutes)]
MNRIIRKFLGGLLTALGIFALPLTAWAEVTILHTNDVHCGVAQNLNIAQVAQYKHDLMKQNPNVLLVDAGDAIQGEPLGSLSEGAAIIRIMNSVGYDFVIPGNHEYDFGMTRFLELAPQQTCGYYSCNFLDKRTGKPVLPSYKIFTMDGKKIAFVGVTTPETLVSSTPIFFQNEDGQFIYTFCEDEDGTNLYAHIQAAVDAARAEGAQCVVLVGHLGTNGAISVWSSGAVAAHTTGINAIIDGHSHEQYSRVDKNKNGEDVVVAQTGTKLATVGKLTIHDDGTITSELVRKLPPPDPAVKAIVEEELAKVDEILGQPVGEAEIDFVTDIDGVRRVRCGETNLGDFVTDALRAAMHTDVALLNGGSFRAPILKGTVTYKSLATTFPFSNTLVVRSVSGAQLLDALELGAMNYPEENGGFMHVSGLTYTIDARIPSSVKLNAQGGFVEVTGERRVKDVMVDGEPLDLTEDYTVGGTNYIMRNGGNGITMFDGTPILRDANTSDLDAIAEFIQEQGGVVGEGYETPTGEGRITILTE